jgi:hypothetical protein
VYLIVDYAEKHFNGRAVELRLLAHTDYTIAITGLYLAFVFYSLPLIIKYIHSGKEPQRTGGKPAWLRCPWICWNFLFCIFSFYGMCHVTPVLLSHSAAMACATPSA